MTHKLDRKTIIQTTTLPSSQSITTSYVEVTGSKCQIELKNTDTDYLYKFSFYTYSTDSVGLLIHARVESSNDNFSSDVQTISGAQVNLGGDSLQGGDLYYQSQTVMFILPSLDREYLRLSVRSYSSDTECNLHRSTQFDGGTNEDVCYNPSLMVLEL